MPTGIWIHFWHWHWLFTSCELWLILLRQLPQVFLAGFLIVCWGYYICSTRYLSYFLYVFLSEMISLMSDCRDQLIRLSHHWCLDTAHVQHNQAPWHTSFGHTFPPVPACGQQPSSLRSTLPAQAFSVVGPMVWNSLPEDMRDPECSVNS